MWLGRAAASGGSEAGSAAGIEVAECSAGRRRARHDSAASARRAAGEACWRINRKSAARARSSRTCGQLGSERVGARGSA
ncbi:hypothetical protein H4R20_007336 [Coemansia guatemalensis]|uniref:Uncharacterized protein n=1 Tax=Coemansia guatemalensis TaxID=2761395 RepID=A0A9W8LNX8_9FUNG|nr:hypothetical protein H4R20_007336 [Coemansia guatemalensis]